MHTILEELRVPFDDDQIKFKLQVKLDDNTGLAAPYVDARAVIDRLNSVVGLRWSEHYSMHYENGIWYAQCELHLYFEQKNDLPLKTYRTGFGIGDDPKAAESDAFKRAAVKFGVGAHLWESGLIKVEISGNKILTPRSDMLAALKQSSVGDEAANTPIGEIASSTHDPKPKAAKPAAGAGAASEKQVNLIKKLLGQSFDNPDELYDEIVMLLDDDELSKTNASVVIEHLLGKKENPEITTLLDMIGVQK